MRVAHDGRTRAVGWPGTSRPLAGTSSDSAAHLLSLLQQQIGSDVLAQAAAGGILRTVQTPAHHQRHHPQSFSRNLTAASPDRTARARIKTAKTSRHPPADPVEDHLVTLCPPSDSALVEQLAGRQPAALAGLSQGRRRRLTELALRAMRLTER